MTVTMVGGKEPDLLVATFDADTPDLALVDALMRWKLVAGRRGRELRLDDVPEALCALLEFAGLAEVLALEPGREAELGEQLGVEEVVQPGDPAA